MGEIYLHLTKGQKWVTTLHETFLFFCPKTKRNSHLGDLFDILRSQFDDKMRAPKWVEGWLQPENINTRHFEKCIAETYCVQ